MIIMFIIIIIVVIIINIICHIINKEQDSMLVQLGEKIQIRFGFLQFWSSSEFFCEFFFIVRQHGALLLIQDIQRL